MRKAVLGMIGAGYLASAQHLPNLMYTQNALLKTVCDIRPEAVQTAMTKYKVPNGETDYKKLLADPEIEGVVIVTQPAQHAELTIAALRAGKHVYVEKPLAESVEDCEKIVAEEKKSGKHVCVGFNRRFAPAYRKAKELLDAHGGAKNIYYRMSDTYSYTWGAKMPPGVRIFHETCHVFDLLRWMTGAEIVGVSCVEARPDDESIVCKFSNGTVATILSSGNSTLDWPKEYMEVISERGGLTVDHFVELWTYGLKNCERRYRFRGHFHPDYEWTSRYVYESFGIEGVRALHAFAPERFELEKKRPVDFPDTPDGRILKEYLETRVAFGYDVDKGWLPSMDHFGECIVSGKKPENASAFDGLRAELIAHAVVKARKSAKMESV